VTWKIRRENGADLDLQIEFARLVQARAEATRQEVSPAQIWRIFADEYLAPAEPTTAELAPGADVPTVVLYVDDQAEMLPPAAKPGRLSAIEAALRPAGIDAHAIAHGGSRLGYFRREGSESGCAVYARYAADEHQVWGVGIDPDVVEASFAAVRSALHRARESAEVSPVDGPQ
jgi:2-isopropylmalate synthase